MASILLTRISIAEVETRPFFAITRLFVNANSAEKYFSMEFTHKRAVVNVKMNAKVPPDRALFVSYINVGNVRMAGVRKTIQWILV